MDTKIKMYCEKNSDQLKTPVKAYVTFEKQEGYEVAGRITGGYTIFGSKWSKEGISFLGQPLFFNKSVEPSNIIWENLQVSYVRQIINSVIVYTIAMLLLFFLLCTLLAIRNKMGKTSTRYQPLI